MKFFEYPYVIITILAMIIVVMGLFGLYFTIKSVRTSKGTEKKSFCGIGKIESEFNKAGYLRQNRSVIYVSVGLDSMKRLYSESKASRLYEQIKMILFRHLCLGTDGEISVYGNENFVVLNKLEADDIANCIEKCYKEISEAFVKNGAVNVVSVYFGYVCTSSTEVNFKTALSRAKQALSMAADKDVLHCQWDSTNGKAFEKKI